MKNKVTWEFSHNNGLDAIWRGTTEKNVVLYAIKKDHELKEIEVREAPKKEKILTDVDIKINKAKDFVKGLDRSKTFVMYEKPAQLIHLVYGKKVTTLEGNNSLIRLKGWTIVARLVELQDSVRMEFYSSIASKKDNFCKQVAIYEAFNNPAIYSINIPFQSFNDNLKIFTGICKELLIHKIEKKAKIRV